MARECVFSEWFTSKFLFNWSYTAVKYGSVALLIRQWLVSQSRLFTLNTARWEPSRAQAIICITLVNKILRMLCHFAWNGAQASQQLPETVSLYGSSLELTESWVDYIPQGHTCPSLWILGMSLLSVRNVLRGSFRSSPRTAPSNSSRQRFQWATSLESAAVRTTCRHSCSNINFPVMTQRGLIIYSRHSYSEGR